MIEEGVRKYGSWWVVGTTAKWAKDLSSHSSRIELVMATWSGVAPSDEHHGQDCLFRGFCPQLWWTVPWGQGR